MARTDFRTPRLYVDQPLATGRGSQARPSADELPRERAQARRRGAGPSVQRPRRRILRQPCGELAQGGLARRRRAHAGPGGAAGRRLSVRAAQARTARLYGAEGGRDGRAALASRHHAPHPGRPREPRASALERDRGLRAVRRDLDAGNRAGRAAWRRRSSAGRPSGSSSSATRRRRWRALSMRSPARAGTAASAS